ncbi:Rad4 beta-hairpin domain 1 family protein [Theileria parva strain Muguga]|uniref:Rad4 beta-hairpin domain 1 family protein n=1 Tax=Theileria parva strain Muguga TaxID=333668 RepID=UPI001C61F1D3|nr:Rad4 beta-hairpin domain 1 family protein [Theileria parva strain Muguga]EAN33610.2 Rad4 beta-hairpin domain 1 family protein [Theileria parva strain Muguga]
MSSDSDGFDLHIQALEEWYKNLSSESKSDLSLIKYKDLPKDKEKYYKTIESYKEKCLALCLVGNVSFINSVIDSPLFKGLCISFFDKYYKDKYEPLLIFKFLISKLKPTVEHSYIKITPLKKGEYYFKLLRAFQTFKAHFDLMTMIFVCICRNNGICSRIVCKYPSNFNLQFIKNKGVWCEFFDTKERFWKYVDFSGPKFDISTYSYSDSPKSEDKSDLNRATKKLRTENVNRNSNGVSKDREISFENNSETSYKGYLYIQRGRKMFIYNMNNKLEVKAIVVFPSYNYKISRMLRVKDFPFELVNAAHSLKVSIINNKNYGTIGLNKNLFILSCNICGIVSEITPKYVQECLLYQRRSSFIEWFDEFLLSLNQRRIRRLTSSFDKSGFDSFNLAERLDIHVINANMLERVDAKLINILKKTYPIPRSKVHFTNHPIYVLKSQIKKNFILKENSVPITSFGDDSVYLKENLVEIKTKLGWHKENRRVISGSNPVHTTHSRHKVSEYYSIDQTEELKQEHIDQIDRFTINLTGNRHVPENSVYIKSEYYENLENICKRNKIFFKRAFSSFHYEDGSVKAKINGVLIRASDLQSFLKLYDEYIESISENELYEELENSRKFWKNVFKTLLNTPPVNKPKTHRDLRTKINSETDKFLNQLN